MLKKMLRNNQSAVVRRTLFMLFALFLMIPVAQAQDIVTLEEQVVGVYDRWSPSVVNVTARSVVFDSMFNAVPESGTGTGWLFDNEGHIVTNFHVIEGADEVFITLFDGTALPAEVIGTDPSNDLAVLEVNEGLQGLEALTLGASENVRVGQFVLAIGSPFGLEQTLTVGVVSSLGRVMESPNGRFIGEVVQTDAAVNPGNSGGPLLNRQGELIGVNTAIISPSRASAGIGFSIPVDTVKRVVPSLIETGTFPHPWLGVNLFDITPVRAEVMRQAGMDLPVNSGAMILETAPSAPADRAGLRRAQLVQIGNLPVPLGGDVIVAINGEPVIDTRTFTVLLESRTRVGETAQLTIIREGQEMVVEVPIGERPYNLSPVRG